MRDRSIYLISLFILSIPVVSKWAAFSDMGLPNGPLQPLRQRIVSLPFRETFRLWQLSLAITVIAIRYLPTYGP